MRQQLLELDALGPVSPTARVNALRDISAEDEKAPPDHFERCRILLADDIDQIRAMLRKTLRKDARFSIVAEASDGLDCVRKAATYRPEVVLLDNDMPVMSGLDAILLIRETSPGTSIVMLSGSDDPVTRARALEAGADGFIVKDSGLDALGDRILELCRPTPEFG